MTTPFFNEIVSRGGGIGQSLADIAEHMPEESALTYQMTLHIGPKETAIMTISAEIDEKAAELREHAFSLVYGSLPNVAD